MSSLKDQGTEQFKQKNFDKAIELYTQAIAENSTDHTIYGNRSAAYTNVKKYQEALNDGNKCIELKPDWGKGYHRKGNAQHGLGMINEAVNTYNQGLEIEPNNAQMVQARDSLR